MFFKAFLVPLVTVALRALALPAQRDGCPVVPLQPNVTDTDVLNFGLIVEQLKSAFYQGGLANFSAANFLQAGYPIAVRPFYQQVLNHSQTFVANITGLLGNQSAPACTFNFTVANVTDFVATSDELEAISTSGYIGSNAYIQNQTLRVFFSSILATTAHQSTWVNNGVRGGNPWSTAYEAPLDLNQTFTLLSPFITQCPTNITTFNSTTNSTTNSTLPFQANPQLTVSPLNAQPGGNVTLSVAGQQSNTTNSTGLFAAFLNGVPATFVPLDSNFTVTIPPSLRGFAYLAVTNSSEAANDTVTVAGPAFFNFPFNANNTIITLTL